MSRPCSGARRIVFLDSFPRMGGAERSFVDLLGALDRRRVEPFFVASEEGEVSREVAKLGIPVLFCSLPEQVSRISRTALSVSSLAGAPRHLAGYLSRLAKTIRPLRVQATYSNTMKDHLATAFLSPVLGKPMFWHFRDLLEKWALRNFVEAVGLTSPVHLIANSCFTARQFRRLSRRCGKVTVVYNGLDLAEIDRRRAELPSTGMPDAEGPVLGLVGALCPEKGQELLLRSLPAVAARVPGVSCWIVGDEIYDTSRHRKGFRAWLEKLAQDLGVDGRVHFLGWRKDVIQLIERMDVMVCASNPELSIETFGRTIVEAMACGKAVVTVGWGGPRETVLDGVTGAIFERYTPQALAEAVIRLTADTQSLRRMGLAGRKRVEELFTIEKYVEGVQDCIEGVLGR